MAKTKILFIADTKFGPRLWLPFFETLGREMEIEAYCLAAYWPVANDFAHPDVFKEAVCIQDELSSYDELDATLDDDLFSTVREFEKTYQTPITHIVQADRHLGRGYFFLGHKHPKSRRSENRNLGQTYRHILALTRRLDEIIRQWQIDVVICSGIASSFGKLLCVVARHKGTRIRILNGSRIGTYYAWYHSEYWSHPLLIERFEGGRLDEAVADEAGTEYRSVPTSFSAQTNKLSMEKKTKLVGSLKAIAEQIGLRVRAYAGSLIKRRPLPKGGYYLSENINYLWRIRRDYHVWQAYSKPVSDILGRRYVFYPLHIEPESASMVFSPEFNNQLAIIDMVAKSLPGDVLLVIKEHLTAIGRRPADFYDWLSEIPNVILVSADARGPQIAQSAQVVITLTGTAGLEAAAVGVPVLTFGMHNLYNAMEHVHFVHDFLRIRPLLADLLDEDAINDELGRSKRLAEGQHFVKSLKSVSTEAGDEVIEYGNPNMPVSPDLVDRVTALFRASLDESN